MDHTGSDEYATFHRPFDLRIIREPGYVQMSPRKRQICWDFGVPAREEPVMLVDRLTLRLDRGSIILLTGPSGSGKSSVLRAIAERAGSQGWLSAGGFPTDRAIVEAISPWAPLATALEILTACGLGEPRLWIRRFADLSEGEQFRASLARAIGSALGGARGRLILCDAFASTLHRRMAKAMAYNLRKLVSRHGLTLVVAAINDDIMDDLQPDQTVRLGMAGPEVILHQPGDRPMSLQRHAVIEEGSVRDYRLFSPMHYRHRDGLGFVDRVFLLRESPGGEPVGILVFAHAPAELALRNQCTEGRFIRDTRRLNRELRILRRLVMHPDLRGCGLGHWFVANTLPRVGVRFVECLASMGVVNPVFERAGMHRVGQCPPPRGRLKLLERLRQFDIDPLAADFHLRIARCPRVRRMVERTIGDWVRRTQGASPYKLDGRVPAELARTFRQIIGRPPVYYLWDRDGVYPRPARAADALPRSRPERTTSPDVDGCRPARGRSAHADRHHPEAGPGTGQLRTRGCFSDEVADC